MDGQKMKKTISRILQITFFIIGTPFYLIDYFVKNKFCEWIINRVNDICFELNWWGNK
jgi:hypothetical protein